MSRINNIRNLLFLFIFIGTLFGGCADQLNISPESAVSPDDINSGNIHYFVNGLYRESFGERDDYFLNDIRGGNYTWTALSGNNSAYGVLITGNSLDDRSAFSSRIWNNAYKNIYNANIIMEAAEGLGEGVEITNAKAETSYLRAYHYYILVTTFGDVPLVLSNTTEDIPRTPYAEVVQQIILDLDFTIANGRGISVTGPKIASIEAAKSLKSRVLIMEGRLEDAALLAQEVIDGTSLAIDINYAGIFRDTDASSEVIFAFENLKAESNIRLSQLFWPYGTAWAGSYFVQPSDYVLHELYSDEDIRKSVNIQTITNADGTYNIIVSKYWDVQPLIITRISELYLICAEALGPIEGIVYLNELRSKRGLPLVTSQEVTDETAYETLVLEERRRELFSEGFLFNDLVRTDRAVTLPNVRSRNDYVMPIPGDQINLSSGMLAQNEGY